jgi:hypothetical protein
MSTKNLKEDAKQVESQGMCGTDRECCASNENCQRFYTYTSSGEEITFCGCPY